MSSQLPSGTVSFLFTDIEGSTQLWEQHPEAMKTALAKHDALLRRVLEAHHGYIFKTVGDAFCVAFASPTDALQAALESQRTLQNEAWGETSIKVRIGLHTGEAEERDGDYFGPPLNRAARLMSAGHGGQILISAALKERLQDSLPHHLTLRDMGQRRLKDLVHPEHLFQLVAPDLPADFPPLKTLDELRTNLPTPFTSFIGRERELAEVKGLLGTTRLLTLTGVGGTGKTRLALQAVSDLIDNFQHGVWLIEMATIADPGLVPQTVASVWQLREQKGRSILEAVTDFLQSRELVLLLDNCEHLIGACAQLSDRLLRLCPKLRIITTSREPLSLVGEVIWSVPSLSLPPGEISASLETLEQFEAVKLFIERARAAQPNFGLSAANARAVTQVCTRLDGIPLALELAAARVRGLGVEQIAARLDNRFRLLAGGSRTALPRQRTLGAAIDWSYDLLSAAEQRLFRRLAVFAGPFTLDSVEDICGGDGIERFEVLDLLLRLLDKSLVISEVKHNETYYRLLETIRQYAREKLLGSGEVEQLSEQHAHYFRQLAEEANRGLRGPNQLEWLQRFSVTRDNWRAALEWVIETHQTEAALQMAVKLDWFWFVRSDHNEGRQWLGRVLALPDASLYSASYVEALTQLAHHLWLQIGPKEARPPAEQALTIARAQGDKPGTAKALTILGLVLTFEHNFAAAQATFEESQALFQEVHDEWGYAHAVMGLGLAASLQGDEAATLILHEQALASFRALGDRFFQCVALRFIGNIQVKHGDWTRGQAALREALILARQLDSKWEIAALLWHFAEAARRMGNPARAVSLLWAAKNAFESIGGLIPADDSELEHELATCHAMLDESEFAEAVAHGRGLTMEQAIELALTETHV